MNTSTGHREFRHVWNIIRTDGLNDVDVFKRAERRLQNI